MGSKTYKVCDRCKVEHPVNPNNRAGNPVQNLNYQIPSADKPLSGAEGKVNRDLCGNCRTVLLNVLDAFFKGEKVEISQVFASA